MTKLQFMEYAHSKGYASTPEEMQSALRDYRTTGKTFDDDIKQPTIFDKRTSEFGRVMDSPNFNAPEKALALVGQSAGVITDYASKLIPDWINKGIERMGQNVVKRLTDVGAMPYIQKGVEKVQEHPRLATDIGNVLNIASLAPVPGIGNMAKKAGEPILKVVGEGVEKAGKGYLESQLKMLKPSAMKGYGKTLIEKKQNIIDNIVEFDLHKSKDFADMNKNAMDQFWKLNDESKAIAQQIENAQVETAKAQLAANKVAVYDKVVARLKTDDPRLIADKLKEFQKNLTVEPTKMSNPVAMVRNAEKDILAEAAYGQGDKVKKIVSSIINDMKKDGMNQNVPITKLIEAKRKIVGDGKIFKLGPSMSADDQINAEIRKDIVSRFLDKVNDLSPEMRQIGIKQKKLMDIARVSDDASSRLANRDPMGLASRIILGGSVPAAATAAATGNPKTAAAILAGGVAQYGIEKSLQQGAGPRKLIKAGKFLQKTSEPSKNIGNMLSRANKKLGQKGEIDLGGKTYGLRPAILSPETGRIYSGKAGMGHKQIFNSEISKQEPKIEKQIWNELFKDNTGEYSPYVGFVDSKGNFIPRAEAEKALSSPKSLVMQFHDASGQAKGLAPLVGVSGAALGGLTAYEIYKKKKTIGNMRRK